MAGFGVGAFFAGTFAVWAVGQLTLRLAPAEPVSHRWPDHPLLDTFARWDTGWYFHIAELGYFYDGPGVQSAVAFFPGYPLLVRLVGFVTGDLIIAGVLVTLVAGALATAAFAVWSRAAVGDAHWRLAVVLLLTTPFAYFLFGAVYSDALFLASALAAFLALERDHPLLAASAGIVATASRPVGLALVAGLLVRSLELDGVLPGSSPRLMGRPSPSPRSVALIPGRIEWRALRVRTLIVGLSVLGLVGYCLLLWWRFGEPFAFAKVETAAGWSRKVDRDSVLMLDYFRRWRDYSPNLVHFGLTLQAILSFLALGLVVPVVRRLGWGYGTYTLLVVGVPLLTSSDFIAMGRYVLMAFPAFAMGAVVLRRQSSRVVIGAVAASALLLGIMTCLSARWMLL